MRSPVVAPAILLLVPLHFSISSYGLNWGGSSAAATKCDLRTLVRIMVRGSVMLFHFTASGHSTGFVRLLRAFLTHRVVSQLQKNEPGAGATFGEAKGIVGALC